MYSCVINVEAQGGPLYVPALDSAGARIDVEQIVRSVIFHHKYMGMTAYEDVRAAFSYQSGGKAVVSSGTPSDMFQKYFLARTFEETVFRMHETDFLPVTIAVHTHQRLECRYGIGEFYPAAEVPGMPQLVHRRKKLLDLGTENPVGI